MCSQIIDTVERLVVIHTYNPIIHTKFLKSDGYDDENKNLGSHLYNHMYTAQYK